MIRLGSPKSLSILLGVAILALGTLRYLDVNPITSTTLPDEAQVVGAWPVSSGHGVVGLLIGEARIAAAAEKHSFQALDLSFGWLSPLEAGFGPIPIVLADDAAAPSAELRALVVTRSALARGRKPADEVLARGGTVLVDLGDVEDSAQDPWLQLAGLELTESAAAVDFRGMLPKATLGAAQRDAFENCAAPRPRARLYLKARDAATEALDEATPPLFFRRAVGGGTIVVAAFDVGRWFATMLQGAPTSDDFTVEEHHGDYEDRIEPDDLVADARLRENEVPFTDLAAHAITGLLDPQALVPLPRILWFEQGSTGTFLMTHDEDLRGGKAMLDLATRDHAHGIRGTHFVVGHPRLLDSAADWPKASDYPAGIRALDGALTVHWNQMPTPHGLMKIEPIQWVATLDEQLSWLDAALSGGSGASRGALDRTINRNHFLMLRPHWSSTYRIMAAAGIAIDSTLAANKGRGFLFGTARPYRLLDDNGLPLTVLELPFQAQEDWGGADAAYFDRLFRDNASTHHGALVTIFHPSSVLKTATDPALVDGVCAVAQETGHRSRTFPEFLAFWRSRSRLELRDLEVEATQLRFRIDGAPDDACIGLPLREGGRVTAVAVDGAAQAIERLEIAGIPYVRFAVPSGDHRIVADFAGN